MIGVLHLDFSSIFYIFVISIDIKSNKSFILFKILFNTYWYNVKNLKQSFLNSFLSVTYILIRCPDISHKTT